MQILFRMKQIKESSGCQYKQLCSKTNRNATKKGLSVSQVNYAFVG